MARSGSTIARWRSLTRRRRARRSEPRQPRRLGPSRGAPARSPRCLRAGLDLPRGAADERVRSASVRTSSGLRGAHAGDGRRLPRGPCDAICEPADARTRAGRDRETSSTCGSQGLIETVPLAPGERRTTLVTLTERGATCWTPPRTARSTTAQRFYAGFAGPASSRTTRSFHRAYERRGRDDQRARRARPARRARLRAEARLSALPARAQSPEARQRRQTRSHAPTRFENGRMAHQLPCEDEHVQFPDVRIEYEDRDGRREIEDWRS